MVDYTPTEITKVFADDTKLDEAIDSGVAVYDDMSITEALDELEAFGEKAEFLKQLAIYIKDRNK